jgi:hypothetical protein
MKILNNSMPRYHNVVQTQWTFSTNLLAILDLIHPPCTDELRGIYGMAPRMNERQEQIGQKLQREPQPTHLMLGRASEARHEYNTRYLRR